MSWIATHLIEPLLVGVMVGVILLLLKDKLFDKSPSSADSTLEKAKKIVKQIEPIKEDEKSYIEPDIGNLQTLAKIAGKISGVTERDAEYAEIIKLALTYEKPGFAYDVAGVINGTTARNNQYVNIIDKCLILKRYALAIKATKHIFSSTLRNEQYKKIIQAGTKEIKNSASNKANSDDAKSHSAD